MSEVVYTVEALIDIRQSGKRGPVSKTIEVLIKWLNYPESENTWEPIANLNKNAAVGMIEDLKERHDQNPPRVKIADEAINYFEKESNKKKEQQEKQRGKKAQENFSEYEIREENRFKKVSTNSIAENYKAPYTEFSFPDAKSSDNQKSKEVGFQAAMTVQGNTSTSNPKDENFNIPIVKKKFLTKYTSFERSFGEKQFYVRKLKIDPSASMKIIDVQKVSLEQELASCDNPEGFARFMYDELLKIIEKHDEKIQQCLSLAKVKMNSAQTTEKQPSFLS